MIRLVTQFDEADARVTAATPSCGCCCCCCCCCVASTISTVTFTAMNLQATARQRAPSPDQVPAVMAAGALSFGVPVVVSIIAGALQAAWLIFAAPVAWGATLFALYRKARHPYPLLPAILIPIVFGILFGAEAIGGAFLLLALIGGLGGVGLALDLLIAAAVTTGGVLLARKLSGGVQPRPAQIGSPDGPQSSLDGW